MLELALTRALLQTPRMASAAGACWGSVMPGERRRVALYVAPTPTLARARAESWSARFGPLGVTCAPLADVFLRPVPIDASRADVFVATPETLLAFVKRARSSADTADRGREVMESVTCVLLDDCFARERYARADVEAALALARAEFAERATPSGARGTSVSYARDSARSEAPWPKHTTRFAVVSAPVSNARELGAWLGAHPSAVRAFGYEHGPTPVSVEVAGFAFPYAKSAFAFERALDEKLADVVRTRRVHDSEPALVFCASREGAGNAARALAASAEATRAAGKGHPFVRDDRHRKSLAAAAARARDATLRRTLPEGVGVYTTAVCRADREFLEVLFETQSVPVLCCAYAAGVSAGGEKKTILPAHVAAPLCVVKGTRRYDGGGAYAEMDAGDLSRVFAACGRAGVDHDARVVIMTHRDTYDLYARRAKGSGETVASTLVTERSALAERVNGLFVCGALTDAADAEAWFDETLAGFGSRRREARDAVEAATRDLRVLGALETGARWRSDANAKLNSGERHAEARLVPTALGAAMDDARATLATMRAFRDADPAPATTRELLLFLCGLAEFGDVALRRNEKKLLREWNRARSSAGGTRFVRFPVMQEARARNANAKDVVATAIRAPREKLFVLAQASMSDAREPNFADAPERARLEAERFAIRAPALARAAFATFAAAEYRPTADGRFSACFAAARLAASLAARRWDDTPTPLSQFVPRAVAARLADAGIVALDDALTRSPRELERAASLEPPFGETLLDKVRALPPAVTVSLSRSALDARGASRIIVRVFSAFSSVDVSKRSRLLSRHASQEDPDPPKWTARVLVGCLWKDTLLFEARVERLSVAAGVQENGAVFERAVDLPPGAAPPPGEESSVVAALVHERCLGRDAHAELALTPRSPASPDVPPAARRARLETPPSAAPRREENDVDAVARVDLTLDEWDEDDSSIASLDFDAPPRKTPRVAAP